MRNLPTEPGSLEAIARRIGPVRPTNFGELFNVRAKPDPDSNAYTAIALPPHVDLPTREYHPGSSACTVSRTAWPAAKR